MYANFGTLGSLNFTGDTQDLFAGLFDTPNRELAPSQGRWISPDPAGSGWNLYGYVSNDPLNLTDPSGLCGPRQDGCTPHWDSFDARVYVTDQAFDAFLNPGDAFINSAIQQFKIEAGLNSPIEQDMNGWYQQEVDAGWNALQPGNDAGGSSSGNGSGSESGGNAFPDHPDAITIWVRCGGEDVADMTCAPDPWSQKYFADGWEPYRVGWPAIVAMFDQTYRMSAGPVKVSAIATGVVVSAPAAAYAAPVIFSKAGVATATGGAILTRFIWDAFGNENEELHFVMPEQPHIPEESGPENPGITEPAPISGPPPK
jgi:RHS repeat-associated protein